MTRTNHVIGGPMCSFSRWDESSVDRWRTLEQLHRWNRPDAFYRIFVFVVVVWAALGTRTQSALRLLAWLALSQRTTLFFFHTSRCYAFFGMGADLPGVRQHSVAFATPETSPSRPRSSARERMRRRTRFARLEYERQHHALAYAATLMLISVVRRVRFAERHGANIVPPHMGPRWPNYWYCTDPT